MIFDCMSDRSAKEFAKKIVGNYFSKKNINILSAEGKTFLVASGSGTTVQKVILINLGNFEDLTKEMISYCDGIQWKLYYFSIPKRISSKNYLANDFSSLLKIMNARNNTRLFILKNFFFKRAYVFIFSEN